MKGLKVNQLVVVLAFGMVLGNVAHAGKCKIISQDPLKVETERGEFTINPLDLGKGEYADCPVPAAGHVSTGLQSGTKCGASAEGTLKFVAPERSGDTQIQKFGAGSAGSEKLRKK